MHDASGSRGGYKHPRLQRIQLPGEVRQPRKIAVRKAYLKGIVATFDQPFILQAATHCRQPFFESFFGAREQHRHQRQLRVLLSPRPYRPCDGRAARRLQKRASPHLFPRRVFISAKL